jgi:hypothetical protein
MTSKFEQLIEFVINDEEQKAKELFHDIVVEKSREIYETLMDEAEELDEESHDEKADDRAERDADKVKKDLEYDYKHGRKVKEDEEEDLDENMMSDDMDLMQDVEAEEAGISEENDETAEFDDNAEEAGDDLTHDMEKDHDEGDIEDRVVDLEDKLDELMAEFEAIMGGEGDGIESDMAGEEGDTLGGDAMAADDTMAFDTDESMMENVDLKAAPKPVTTEPAGTNTKSTVAVNSGAKGMQGAPVRMTGDTAQGRAAPKTGDLPGVGSFKNAPAKDGSKLAPAPKPVTAQAAGVNTTTPFPKG